MRPLSGWRRSPPAPPSSREVPCCPAALRVWTESEPTIYTPYIHLLRTGPRTSIPRPEPVQNGPIFGVRRRPSPGYGPILMARPRLSQHDLALLIEVLTAAPKWNHFPSEKWDRLRELQDRLTDSRPGRPRLRTDRQGEEPRISSVVDQLEHAQLRRNGQHRQRAPRRI